MGVRRRALDRKRGSRRGPKKVRKQQKEVPRGESEARKTKRARGWGIEVASLVRQADWVIGMGGGAGRMTVQKMGKK